MAWYDWQYGVGDDPLPKTLGDAALNQQLVEEDLEHERERERTAATRTQRSKPRSNPNARGCWGIYIAALIVGLAGYLLARLS